MSMLASSTLSKRDSAAPALVAVSGGRDSVVLLHRLVLAGTHPSLIVCHLNHGLRARESGQDAAFVRRLAKSYGLLCEVEKADVQKLAKKRRVSLEVAAREARYDFLQRMAKKHAAQRIYLAHHADDQAETILANLCRGTSVGGLRGMSGETALGEVLLVRPLLTMRRADLEAYVETHGLTFREDSSNQSPAHRRNRLRHEALPLLNHIYDRDVVPAVTRLGRMAGRDEDCLYLLMLEFAQSEAALAADGSLKISAKLSILHPALLSRLLHYWLVEKLGLPGIDADVLEAALSMLKVGGPAKINLPGHRWLRRKARRLWVEAG